MGKGEAPPSQALSRIAELLEQRVKQQEQSLDLARAQNERVAAMGDYQKALGTASSKILDRPKFDHKKHEKEMKRIDERADRQHREHIKWQRDILVEIKRHNDQVERTLVAITALLKASGTSTKARSPRKTGPRRQDAK